MTIQSEQSDALLTIGALSKATGVPSDTLRTWERRYGFPEPLRLESGHRRYRCSTIDHIKLIGHAIEQGHRPSQVVGIGYDALLDLMAQLSQEMTQPCEFAVQEEVVARWMDLVLTMGQEELVRDMNRFWFQSSPIEFFHSYLVPFIYTVGERWARSEIAVFHEQFASRTVVDFLQNQWKPLSEQAQGPRALLCTLPGEFHALGLHMVASLLSISGWRVELLGLDCAPYDIAQAAQPHDTVMVSISSSANTQAVERHVRALKAYIGDEDVPVVLGGAGATLTIQGVECIQDLDVIFDWAKHTRH